MAHAIKSPPLAERCKQQPHFSHTGSESFLQTPYHVVTGAETWPLFRVPTMLLSIYLQH